MARSTAHARRPSSPSHAIERARCRRVAQARRALDDRVEHRLQVGRRGRDDPQHLGGRRLLLQRLASARRLRCSSSSNSRAFSMAITAWSANVSSSAICASVNGAHLLTRSMLSTPIALALAQQRRRDHRCGRRSGMRGRLHSELGRRAARTSATWIVRRSRAARPVQEPAIVTGMPTMPTPAVAQRPSRGARGREPPSTRAPDRRRCRRVAQPGSALDDGVEDALEVRRRRGDHPQDLGRRGLLLQRLAQLGRLRCSSSSKSRAFSMAMTAWSANVSSSAICWSVNGATSVPDEREDTDGSPSLQQRHAEDRRDNRVVALMSRSAHSQGRPPRPDVDVRRSQPPGPSPSRRPGDRVLLQVLRHAGVAPKAATTR